MDLLDPRITEHTTQLIAAYVTQLTPLVSTRVDNQGHLEYEDNGTMTTN